MIAFLIRNHTILLQSHIKLIASFSLGFEKNQLQSFEEQPLNKVLKYRLRFITIHEGQGGVYLEEEKRRRVRRRKRRRERKVEKR